MFKKGPVVQYAHAAADELAADIGERRGKQVTAFTREHFACVSTVTFSQSQCQNIKRGICSKINNNNKL